MKKAIFPGSFDPITLGHFDIINRGVTLFDEVIIAIGENSSKDYMYSLEERKQFIENTFKDNPKVKVLGTWARFIDEKGNFLHNLKLPTAYSIIKKKMYLNSIDYK